MRGTFIKSYNGVVAGTQFVGTTIEAINLLREGIITIQDFFEYPAGKPGLVMARLTRPADTNAYLAGDAINASIATPVDISLVNMGIVIGGGGMITELGVRTNMVALAGNTIRIYLYRLAPTSLVGDNVPLTQLAENTQKGGFYIDITFDPLLAGSDVVLGHVQPFASYVCDTASSALLMRVQTLAAFTPTSAGWIDFDFTLTQQG